VGGPRRARGYEVGYPEEQDLRSAEEVIAQYWKVIDAKRHEVLATACSRLYRREGDRYGHQA